MVNRVLIDEYGMKLSKAGVDVFTADPKDLLFDSNFPAYRVVAQGVITHSTSGWSNITWGQVRSVSHGYHFSGAPTGLLITDWGTWFHNSPYWGSTPWAQIGKPPVYPGCYHIGFNQLIASWRPGQYGGSSAADHVSRQRFSAYITPTHIRIHRYSICHGEAIWYPTFPHLSHEFGTVPSDLPDIRYFLMESSIG